jgi:hypothetical protein
MELIARCIQGRILAFPDCQGEEAEEDVHTSPLLHFDLRPLHDELPAKEVTRQWASRVKATSI